MLSHTQLAGQGDLPGDQSTCRSCFVKASDLGIREASYKLGQCHEDGWGCTQSMSQAVRLYQLAADGMLMTVPDVHMSFCQYSLGHERHCGQRTWQMYILQKSPGQQGQHGAAGGGLTHAKHSFATHVECAQCV